MRCARLVELLADYLDGIVPAHERQAMDQHLTACSECVAFVRTYRTTVHLLRTLRDDDLPPALREILTKIRRANSC